MSHRLHIVELMSTENDRANLWASTMGGHASSIAGLRVAHIGQEIPLGDFDVFDRQAREDIEDRILARGATRASGAGVRARTEEPDLLRTCFERDRDRILHSNEFRRLAGKTQVFIFPADHQRTRLTHALEVAQVATAIATACRLNTVLAEAIAIGHDCGHGPGGHASEDALSPFLGEEFNHAVWGADVMLAPLNLCAETLDGVRNHSWSRPSPTTPEGVVVGIADRVAYCAHDLEDAVSAGVVTLDDLPQVVVERCGRTRSQQLRAFIRDVVITTQKFGMVGLSDDMAEALAALRRFNYERIYLRPSSIEQGRAVISLLSALVEHYANHPKDLPENSGLVPGDEATIRRAVTYVSGMTDKFACAQATSLLSWPADQLPKGLSPY
jgi:dGTPase